MSSISATLRVDTGKNVSDLSSVDKHNNRKFKEQSQYQSSYINRELIHENEILIGTDNIVDDLKKTYEETFGKAVSEYNAKQRRSDRKIYDYFEKINSSKKANLYVEVILQIGDKDFWGDKSLEERKKMYIPFAKKQLEIFKELVPDFKIANAIIHFDETSPHIQLVGIGYSTGKKRGLTKQATTSIAKSKRDLVIIQDKFKKKNIQEFNKMFDLNLTLKPKQQHRRHLTSEEYKENKEKLQNRIKELKKIVEKKGLFDKVVLTTAQLKEINKFLDDEVCITHNEELLADLEKNVIEKKTEIQELNQKNATLKATLERLENNNKKYTIGITNNRRIIRNQTRNIQRNRGMERNLTQTISKLQAEQKALEKTTQDLKNTMEKATKEMERILEELQLVKDLKTLKEKATKLKRENQELETSNQELKKVNQELKATEKKLAHDIAAKQEEKNQIQLMILSKEKINSQVHDLERQKKTLEETTTKLTADNQGLSDTNKKLKKEEQLLNKKVEELKKEKTLGTAALTDIKETYKKLKQSSISLVDKKYEELEKLAKLKINKSLSWTLNPKGTKELAQILAENSMLQAYYKATINQKPNQELMENLLKKKELEKKAIDPWTKQLEKKDRGLGR